jgi:hypothetical protein
MVKVTRSASMSRTASLAFQTSIHTAVAPRRKVRQ